MSGGVVCPPVEPAPAWGLAAQVSRGFRMSGMKPAADAATNPVLMKLRRENPDFFMSRLLSGAYSFWKMRGLPSKAPRNTDTVQGTGLRPREKILLGFR